VCGFLVAVGPSGVQLRTPEFEAGFQRLAHRGPDSRVDRETNLPWGHASMSTCRLAITGHDDGHEASRMTTSLGDIVVAFNGEIYNHHDLRRELDDCAWRTECDTEVILHAWRRWGASCVEHLNGMFAFVLVDPRSGVVFAVRDRAGEKPLYIAELEGATFFASEIKALPVPLREVECLDMEALEFDIGPTTPFAGVAAVRPGHCVRLDGCLPRETAYWELPVARDPAPGSLRAMPVNINRLLDELTETVVDAIRIRASTTQPLVALVSGGLDSAIIHAVAQAEHLYTVAFDDADRDDLLMTAQRAADGYRPGHRILRPVSFGLDDARAWLGDIAYHLDTPATWTAIAQWALARAIRDNHGHGAVVLTGEGADETFGGYSRYRVLSHIDAMRDDVVLEHYRPLQHHLVGSDHDILTRLLDRSDGVHIGHAREIVHNLVTFAEHRAKPSLVRAAMRLDWHTTMQVLLRMLDRMFMAQSLEPRCPFLDHRVVELAAQLPCAWVVGPAGTKLALREVARRLGVHRTIIDEPSKRGFYCPWNAWTGAARGTRGAWDRSDFFREMKATWRSRFGLRDPDA
jgi:asparagine synthase (glutamine-hydrolysing)